MTALTDAQATYLDELKASVEADAKADAPILAEIAKLQATLSTAKDPTSGERRRTYRMLAGGLAGAHRPRPVAPPTKPPS